MLTNNENYSAILNVGVHTPRRMTTCLPSSYCLYINEPLTLYNLVFLNVVHNLEMLLKC